jgi:hypothetical protein
MNKVTDDIMTGTLGELLVQIRLLQFGIQAAPPIKDSGNDLIAVNGEVFRAISVRTTTELDGKYNRPPVGRRFHVLAVVHLIGQERHVYLDESPIYLVPGELAYKVPVHCKNLEEFLMKPKLVESLFGPLPSYADLRSRANVPH